MKDNASLEQGMNSMEYNAEYERQGQSETEWVGDGHFVDQTWLFGDGTTGAEVPVTSERPALLYTCLRWPSLTMTGKSIAHSNHPFVAFVHLLATAEKGSKIFMSAPFLSDFRAIDQLCHYADPEVSNLSIFILLGPVKWNIDSLKAFVDVYENRRQAVARLHIKVFGEDNRYYHSKAIVTSAGTMIGSYNYTKAAREDHYEHATLLGPDFPQAEGLRAELGNLWNSLPHEIDIPKWTRPQNAEVQSIANPYKRNKPSA